MLDDILLIKNVKQSNSQEKVHLELENSLVFTSTVSLMNLLPGTYSRDIKKVQLHILRDDMHYKLQLLSLFLRRRLIVKVSERS